MSVITTFNLEGVNLIQLERENNYMKKYMKDYYATLLIVLVAFMSYIVKLFVANLYLRAVALFIILGFSLTLILQNKPSVKHLEIIQTIKAENADKATRSRKLIKATKELYQPMSKLSKGIAIVVPAVALALSIRAIINGHFNEVAYNNVLDLISYVSLLCAFLQLHINFSIVKELEDN